MARTNVSGWLATRVALAAATLVAGGAIVASTSSFAPNVALADEAQFTEVAQDAQTGTATVQVSGTYYLDSAQSVVDSLQSTRAEGSELVQTDALDAKAQVLAAQYAYMGIHSAQSADECVTYLEAAQAGNPADAVAGMTTDWFTEGSPLNNTEYGYFGIALFQTQDGDLYLVAVFSNEAGNMGEADQLVKPQDGTGKQDDGTEVGVPATVNVTVPAEDDATPQDSGSAAQAFTVYFNPNGGSGEAITATTETDGSIKMPACTFTAPDGKQFKCWSADRDDQEAKTYQPDETYTPSGDQENFYAIWEDVPVTQYSVNFNPNGGEGQMDSETVDAGGSITVPECTYTAPDGMQFQCWATDQQGLGTTYQPGEAYTPSGDGENLYAIWEDVPVTQYSVYFNPNGGTGDMQSVTVNAGDPITVPECTYAAPEGQQFKCWAANREGEGTTYLPGDAYVPSGDQENFYAIWEDVPVTQYSVYFNPNGGTGDMQSVTVNAGDPITVPECTYTAPEGQQFKGWAANREGEGTIYQPGDAYVPSGDQENFYAIWEDVPVTTVNINFDANGGSGVMESVSAEVNEGYIVPGCSFTAPAGKHFKYWAANREGNAPVYQQEDILTPTAETTLYAIWEDDATSQVSISFNANGGTGSMDAVTVDLGSSTTLPKATFTRSGYVFAGWNTKADGTGSSFADGANITPGTNVTLYAKWNQTKYINGIQNNLKVTTTVGTKPTLPTTAGVRWSDGTTSSESVVWTEPDNYQSLYSAVGSFQVTGIVQGHNVKCTVNVVAASDNSGTNNNGGNSGTSTDGTTYNDVSQDQANTIAKTGDETDYTPIAIAAGVGVVVVILAVALILKSRKK